MNADYSQSQNKPVFELSPYECIVHAVVGSVRGLSSAILKALECSKRLTERQPNNAFAWSARATVLFNQRSMGIGLPSDQIQHTDKRLYLNEEILRGATRAVELAPDDAFAQRTYALAMSTKCQIHLYRQELEKASRSIPTMREPSQEVCGSPSWGTGMTGPQWPKRPFAWRVPMPRLLGG